MSAVALTGHDGDCLERPEDPERPEAGEIAHLDERGEVAGGDHREVQPVPRIPERADECHATLLAGKGKVPSVQGYSYNQTHILVEVDFKVVHIIVVVNKFI